MPPDLAADIDAALAAGDVPRAVAIARRALAAGDRDPFTRNLVAWQQVTDGDPAGGEEMAREGLQQAPEDPGLLVTLGLALRRQGRLADALRAFDAAIQVAPAYPLAWLERGFALHQGNSLQAASDSYARAAGLDPASAPALAGIAAIAAVQEDFGRARDFAGRALAVDGGNAVAHCALARAEIADGAAAAAAARMQALLRDATLTIDNRSAALSLLGDGLARLGDAAAACAAWAESKASLGVRFPHLLAMESQFDLAVRIDRHVVAGPPRFAAPAGAAGRRAAFLLGYPRSGTTLVETILAGIDGVEALEEMPTLAAAEAELLRADGGLARLDALDAEAAAALRDGYWLRATTLGLSPAARLFIDMDPMKSLHLPLIARLFPAAPVIVMRRDPRDVVLSCFRQNFAASPIALEFTTLVRAARHYDALMRLQRHCLDRMANPVLELRYEELVADFDGVTKRLCDFLGLPWSPGLRDFAATARQRAVSTASVGQVRRGLFDGGGQWKRFAGPMAEVLPVLAPWVAAFGYGAQ